MYFPTSSIDGNDGTCTVHSLDGDDAKMLSIGGVQNGSTRAQKGYLHFVGYNYNFFYKFIIFFFR